MSIPKMKNEFKEEIRNKLLSSKVMELEFSRLTASNKEVEDFYNAYKDSIPKFLSQFHYFESSKM